MENEVGHEAASEQTAKPPATQQTAQSEAQETASTLDAASEQTAATSPGESPAPEAEAAPKPAAPAPEPTDDDLQGLPADASSWDPPARTAENWDWVLLTTGEWLKGEISSVRDGDMEIDSDQFGELVVDMADVAAIYAYRPHIYQLENRDTFTGVGILRNGILTIDGHELPRADFMGMVEGRPRELDFWRLKFNVSLALRSGNTEQTTLSDSLFLRRDAPSNRFTLDTNGSVGESGGSINVQNQNATAQFDVFVSKVFYVTPVLGAFTHDRFQNIDARVIPASGVGFHAIASSAVTWDLETAGGYQYIDYRTVAVGEDEINNDGVVRFATRFEADIGDPVEVDLSWNSNVVVSDIGRTFHHGTLTFELEVTEVVDTTISVIYDRIEQPQRAEDGTLPKSNDIQLNFGVQLDLG